MSALILVVDDEPDVADLFRQQFRRELRASRFAMEFAQSATDALERVRAAEAAKLILILSDINMPGMSGLDLLPRVRQARPDVPVIMITAYGDSETRRKAAEAGAAGLFTKPIDFLQLRGEIGRRLDASRVPVVYHSRNPAKDVSYKHYPDLIEMAKAVDTLVVIVPGGPATAKMINADVLKALGPRDVIVNVARGSVVDEEAMIAALKSGTILAAGLDVFANEPTVPDELRAMQNVVLLPHIGSASVVTRNAMDQLVVDNLKTWFAGKPPLTPIAETPAKGR